MLVALFTLVIASIGATSSASAQIPQCPCTYVITASCSIPPNCFPYIVTSRWTNGATAAQVVNTCGSFTYPIPPPCPPQPGIVWASLDGGATMAFPNGPPVRYFFPPCPPVCLSVTVDMFGCVSITILPC
ncbi:MAG: hypothetical protein JWQ98_1020 [Chlorobi bacterium]|nr:hypothetical protein [Chlorobiota bacterium]